MTTFKKYIEVFAQKLDFIAAFAILAMMLLTCTDVILRLFRKPIPGTYEMVSFLGALAVSFAIAHTTFDKGHVAVSLVVRLFPQKIQGIIEILVSLLGTLLFAMISWQSLLYGMDCQTAGEVSLTLKLPLYPVIYALAFGTGAVCLVLFVDVLNALEKVKNQ